MVVIVTEIGEAGKISDRKRARGGRIHERKGSGRCTKSEFFWVIWCRRTPVEVFLKGAELLKARDLGLERLHSGMNRHGSCGGGDCVGKCS